MDSEDYVIDWGPDGTAYLRLPSLAPPPPAPPEPASGPADEEVPDGADEPFAYGRPARTVASR